MAEDLSFIKRLNEGQIGQLLKFAGTVNGAFGAALGVISLFEESDTEKILGAIEQLREDMERNFQQLGDLIKEQTRIVVDTVNRDTMALALANSDVAFSRMQEFLANNNNAALETAKTESIRGVSFFTNLGLDSPDLSFFLPGLVKAGTIRIFVIAAEPEDLQEPRVNVEHDVSLMATYLATMIDNIKRKVNAAHTIRQHSHSISCPQFFLPPGPADESSLDVFPAARIRTIVEGFAHEEHGVRLQFFATDPVAEIGPAKIKVCEEGQKDVASTQASAIQARIKGVDDELAFLGIPTFEGILQSWRTLVSA